MSAPTAAPPTARGILARHTRPSAATMLAAAVVAAILAFQAAKFFDLLGAVGLFYSAASAKQAVWANAAAVGAVAVLALVLPARLRWIPAAGPLLLAAGVAAATAVLGGKAGAMAAAVLTMTCAWQLGEPLLRRLGAPRLAALAPAAWLTGLGLLGLVITVLGRIDALRWWTLGLIVVGVGGIGAVRAARLAWARRGAIVEATTGDPLGAAATGIVGLTLAWALVYAAAPEIMFDAVYAKAWLPELWAHTGGMQPLLEHPVLNVTGLAQVLAVPGHVLGAEAVGRYLQLCAWVAAVVLVWWWGRRHGAVGALAAAAVAVVPHVIWQATTAYDDLFVAVAALAMAVAVAEASAAGPAAGRPLVAGLALGLMAGTCVALKLHLVPVAVVLVLAWAWRGRADGSLVARLGGVAAGAVITGAPSFVLRWIDTGNPVFPAYNNIFRSPHALPVNEKYNFPFWPDAGTLGPVKAIWQAVHQPDLMTEAVPPGAFGLLVGAVVVAVAVGWTRRGAGRPVLALWASVVVALVMWWMQFRYVRYLLPVGLLSVAIVLAVASPPRLSRAGQAVAVTTAALAAVLFFTSTIASYWNVPRRNVPLAAALGRWDARDYEREAFPERDAIAAYDRAAPDGALAASNPHERVWLHGTRDLTPVWELEGRLLVDGPLPATAGEALRRWRADGVQWAILTGPKRAIEGPGYLPALLREHGDVVFSDRGVTVFHLVDRPAVPRPLAPCDPRLTGAPRCWDGTLDRRPGVTAAESPTGATRSVPVCPGQTVVVDAAAGRGGQPSAIQVETPGYDKRAGHETADLPPGGRARVDATAPPGASRATVALRPGPGATVTEARVSVLGPRC